MSQGPWPLCGRCRVARLQRQKQLRTESLERRRLAARLVVESTARVRRACRRAGALLAPGVRGACRDPAPVPPEGELAGMQVLLVDDEFLVRDATRLVLEAAGARVTLAVDGVEALEILGGRRVDLVLCDLRMPRLDGFGFVRQLRQDPQRADLPVVALSAATSSRDRQQVREAGFDDQLDKPVGEDRLLATLAAWGRRAA